MGKILSNRNTTEVAGNDERHKKNHQVEENERMKRKIRQKKRMSAGERALAAKSKATLTGTDVAAVARISTRAAYSALASGAITQAPRVGTYFRVTYQQVLNWIAAGCPQGGAS